MKTTSTRPLPDALPYNPELDSLMNERTWSHRGRSGWDGWSCGWCYSGQANTRASAKSFANPKSFGALWMGEASDEPNKTESRSRLVVVETFNNDDDEPAMTSTTTTTLA